MLLKQKSVKVIVLCQIPEWLFIVHKRQYSVSCMIWPLIINSASSCLFSLVVLFIVVKLFHCIPCAMLSLSLSVNKDLLSIYYVLSTVQDIHL